MGTTWWTTFSFVCVDVVVVVGAHKSATAISVLIVVPLLLVFQDLGNERSARVLPEEDGGLLYQAWCCTARTRGRQTAAGRLPHVSPPTPSLPLPSPQPTPLPAP